MQAAIKAGTLDGQYYFYKPLSPMMAQEAGRDSDDILFQAQMHFGHNTP